MPEAADGVGSESAEVSYLLSLIRRSGTLCHGRDVSMDSLDVRILRLVTEGRVYSPLPSAFHESLAAAAKRTGADEETVRYRLKRIQDLGFFADWRLYVNPRFWGGGQISAWFDVDPTSPKRELVNRLRLIPGVLFITALYDGLTVFVEYDDEVTVPRTLELIRRLAGVLKVFVARTAFPECHAEPTRRDWDVIRALRRRPRKSYSAVAREIGASARTVRRRLLSLGAQGMIFAWPSLNMRARLGGVFVHLVAWYPGDRKSEVDTAVFTQLEPYHWHTMHMFPYQPGDLWPCGYDLFVPNVSIGREVLNQVLAIPGVERARAYLHEDIYNLFDAYDEALDRRLQRLPTATSVPGTRRPRRTPAANGA